MNVGSAANAAVRAAHLRRRGQPPSAIWRQTILELLEVYEAWQVRGAADAAALLFSESPQPSGDRLIDEALPAFAEHLANRDHWQVPQWALATTTVPEPRRRAGRQGRHARWSPDAELAPRSPDAELQPKIDVA
jgi:hypothetical protein